MRAMNRSMGWTWALGALLLAGAGGAVWLFQPHEPSEAVAVAAEFTALLQRGELTRAHQLTTGTGQVGRSPAELALAMQRHCTHAERVVWTLPLQTNGNRLRRRLTGRPIEVPEVTVEIEDPCLLAVHVRHGPDGRWRVSRFASHAG